MRRGHEKFSSNTETKCGMLLSGEEFAGPRRRLQKSHTVVEVVRLGCSKPTAPQWPQQSKYERAAKRARILGVLLQRPAKHRKAFGFHFEMSCLEDRSMKSEPALVLSAEDKPLKGHNCLESRSHREAKTPSTVF